MTFAAVRSLLPLRTLTPAEGGNAADDYNEHTGDAAGASAALASTAAPGPVGPLLCRKDATTSQSLTLEWSPPGLSPSLIAPATPSSPPLVVIRAIVLVTNCSE